MITKTKAEKKQKTTKKPIEKVKGMDWH